MTRRAGFLAGLFAAALAALPSAWRFGPDLRWQAYFVCWAGCALVMAPLAAALASSNPTPFRSALTLGALLSVPLLLPLSSVLKTTTHHRPLGGVTFAVLAGGAIVALSLFSGRVMTWAGEQQSSRAPLWRALLSCLAVLGTAAALYTMILAANAGDGFKTGIFDALRVLALATLAARVRLPPGALRRLRGLGLATWIAVVTVGVCLGRAPAMQAELAIRCPVLHWPLVWLGG